MNIQAKLMLAVAALLYIGREKARSAGTGMGSTTGPDCPAEMVAQGKLIAARCGLVNNGGNLVAGNADTTVSPAGGVACSEYAAMFNDTAPAPIKAQMFSCVLGGEGTAAVAPPAGQGPVNLAALAAALGPVVYLRAKTRQEDRKPAHREALRRFQVLTDIVKKHTRSSSSNSALVHFTGKVERGGGSSWQYSDVAGKNMLALRVPWAVADVYSRSIGMPPVAANAIAEISRWGFDHTPPPSIPRPTQNTPAWAQAIIDSTPPLTPPGGQALTAQRPTLNVVRADTWRRVRPPSRPKVPVVPIAIAAAVVVVVALNR